MIKIKLPPGGKVEKRPYKKTDAILKWLQFGHTEVYKQLLEAMKADEKRFYGESEYLIIGDE